jgi:hypothetical protein
MQSTERYIKTGLFWATCAVYHKFKVVVSFQCEEKEFFVEKITSMDLSVQQELVVHIREVIMK